MLRPEFSLRRFDKQDLAIGGHGVFLSRVSLDASYIKRWRPSHGRWLGFDCQTADALRFPCSPDGAQRNPGLSQQSRDPGLRFAPSGLRAESRRTSSPRVYSDFETRRSSLLRRPRKGNAERRAVQPHRGATCCGTHGSVHLREAHGGVWPCGSHGPARAPYRPERDGLGNRNTLRSAKRRFYQLATPSSVSAGALTKCGHRRIAGSLGRPPTHTGTSLPLLRVCAARERPTCATGPSHPLRAVTYHGAL